MTTQFTEIGRKYGPFDIAFIKIAAYHENWPDIHLNPEQAIEAHLDVNGRVLVPIHWGTFDLSLHSWYEPIERFVAAAEKANARTVTPKMGEFVDSEQKVSATWWRDMVGAQK
jgi:L-ascorbate metabolism protein UlaG (beta-lactamase superfamily)